MEPTRFQSVLLGMVLGRIFNKVPLGEVIMADLRNNYGEVVYRIEGDRIIDIYGNWKYEFRGEYIYDTCGNRLYEIKDEYIYDTYGKMLGEVKNLADILPPPSGSNSTSSYGNDIPSKKTSDGSGGFFWGCVLGLMRLIYSIWKANIGGKIGVILGVVFLIITFAADDIPVGNVIFIGPVFILLFGTVGAVIGGIIKKITRQREK